MRHILIFIFTFSAGIITTMQVFHTPATPTTSAPAGFYALGPVDEPYAPASYESQLQDQPPMENLEPSDQRDLQNLLDSVD